ncbi:MAG TPA: type I methionyl aminopeptidase [Bacteroidia bacterium]|nr:type I methionyl aminopeptidase [Bacteroidia bacterium]
MLELEKYLEAGIKVESIEKKTRDLIAEVGATSGTIGYTPRGASFPFPSAVCTSINEGIAHGISKDNKRQLKNGDVVSLDVVIKFKGLFVDTCRTYGIGDISQEDRELIATARETTDKAIEAAILGNTTEDIGKAVEKTAREFGFDTVKELGGHGVGRKVHEEPFIPNAPNLGVEIRKIKEGMVLAIEPIVTAGD